jgi:hypothetical protein
MNEQTPKPKQQFFIAAYDGDQKSFVSSDHVVSLSPVRDHPHYTHIRTDGGGAYSHTLYVRAPFARVTALFAERGYDFLDVDEVPPAPPAEPEPAKKPRSFLGIKL